MEINKADSIRRELRAAAIPGKAEHLLKFFKTSPGGYGEGDKFIGVIVPVQRKIAKDYYQSVALDQLQELLNDPYHECRMTALFMLVLKFEKALNDDERYILVNCYLDNLDYVNNWDLVDATAHNILGPYLEKRDRTLIYQLASSGKLWHQRIAVLTTFHFIRNRDYSDTLRLAEMLLDHKHDLIHKAVGWMLREIGKNDYTVEYNFLKRHYKKMPRTMLRYAIEKFELTERKKFLAGEI